MFWRKVILVIFVIFELGPDSESLCNALPSESISCGIRAFFHPKNCLWSFGPKKWEKSQRCKKHLQLCSGRNVTMVLLLFQISTIMTFLQNRHEAPLWHFSFFPETAPLWHFSRTDMQHLCDFSLRIKKTRIFGRSTRSEALRTIQYLSPAGLENIWVVRKFQNFDQNSKF